MTELPQGWTWASLGEIGDWYGGGTPSKRRDDFWADGTIPWLSPKDMRQEILHNTIDNITSSAVTGSAVNIVPPTSVALVVRSGILNRVVPIASVPFETTLNQDMKAVVPYPGISHAWVRFCLISQEATLRTRCRKDGTTVASLDTAKLLQFEIPIPPTAEQIRIADFLDASLSELDSATDQLGTVRNRLRRYVSSVIREGAAQENGGESASSFLDRLNICRRSAATKRVSKALDPAYTLDLPDGWLTVSIDQIASSIDYGTSTKARSERQNGDIAVLRMGNIKDGRIQSANLKYMDQDDPSLANIGLASGDVLFNRTNSAELVGKAATYREEVVPATFASYLIRVRLLPEIDPDWIVNVINGPIGRTYINSVMTQQVGQANVNGTKLARMPIPLPPPAVIRTKMLSIASAQELVERTGETIDRSMLRVLSLRRQLLHSGLSGRLVDQDPADESADVLLSRIRIEREAAAPSKSSRKPRTRKATTP